MPGQQPVWSAVLAPGGNNNADVPLLMYARLAAERRGASVRVVSWELAGAGDFTRHREMVVAKVAAAVTALSRASAPFLLAGGCQRLAAV